MPINNFSVISASEAETLSGQMSGDRLYQLVKDIDNIVRNKAEDYLFQADVTVASFDEYEKIPQEIYTLTNIYQSRGFQTHYDGTPQDLSAENGDLIVLSPVPDTIGVIPSSGLMTIKWYAPRMTYQDIEETPNPEIIRIPDLGFNFYAHNLYLCQTNGVDLRQFTKDWILRQLDVLIKRSAINGENQIRYLGPNGLFQKVPNQSLISLYTEVIDSLVTAGYNASFDSSTLWISWTPDTGAPPIQDPIDADE